MRIVQLIDSLRPGGAERFVVDLSNQLAENNEVYVMTFRNRGANCDFYRNQLSPKVKQITYYSKSTVWAKIWQLFFVLKEMLRIRPDIIHTHLVAFNYAILPFFLIPRVKVFYTIHNVADKDTEMGIVATTRKVLLRNRFCGITISPYCEKTFQSFYGYSSFAMIENGCRPLTLSADIDNARQEIQGYKHTDRTKVFVCVARIMEAKNHILLIDSFNRITKEGYDVELLLIGSWDYDLALKEKLDEAIQCDRIHFLGVRENVPDYLALCDFFCLSSLWEGLPISILEAGMSGCYPISTPVGGVPDVLKDDNWGLLSTNLSVDCYCEALKKALNTNVDREALARLYNSHYTMKTCADKYLRQYERALETR